MLTVAEAAGIDPGRKGARVIIEGNVHFYKDKAPFEKSGFSLRGALELDPTADQVKCHECGKWVRSIGAHLQNSCETAQGIGVRAYKERHGFSLGTSLITEGTREKMIAHGDSIYKNLKIYWEKRSHSKVMAAIRKRKVFRVPRRDVERENVRNACKPQTLERIRALAKQVGHTPKVRELKEVGIGYDDLVYHFGSSRNAMKFAGLEPRTGGGSTQYTKEQLVSIVKVFFRSRGRRPVYSDVCRGLLPSAGVFRRCFKGGLCEANRVAGLQRTIK